MTVKTLTEPQRKALTFLASVTCASPAAIGYAMTPARKHPLKAQGAGRLGGTMAARLMRNGLVCNASYMNSGFAAYAITAKGRQALND